MNAKRVVALQPSPYVEEGWKNGLKLSEKSNGPQRNVFIPYILFELRPLKYVILDGNTVAFL